MPLEVPYPVVGVKIDLVKTLREQHEAGRRLTGITRMLATAKALKSKKDLFVGFQRLAQGGQSPGILDRMLVEFVTLCGAPAAECWLATYSVMFSRWRGAKSSSHRHGAHARKMIQYLIGWDVNKITRKSLG